MAESGNAWPHDRHGAARAGALKVCLALIQLKASVSSARADGGLSALHLAAECRDGGKKAGKSSAAICVALAEAKAGVGLTDDAGRTALHHAAAAGHAAACLALVTKGGAEPDAADAQGRTALHHAAEEGHTAACPSAHLNCRTRQRFSLDFPIYFPCGNIIGA